MFRKMLTERRRRLLQLIVDEYVNTAQPVGSGSVAQKHNMPYSPATIRNEMAALEDEGFITHPHTSAGRVPTDLGYRYYVQTLMREEKLPEDLKQTIRHQFHQAARELDEWARLCAAIIAGRLQNAAVVSTPHSSHPRLRLVELVSVHENLALLIVVLQEARVVQQTIPLEQPMTQDELTALARRLNEIVGGKTAAELRAQTAAQPGAAPTEPATPAEGAIIEATAALLETAETSMLEPSFMEGMRDLLKQPEFARGEQLLSLLELLEERNLSRAIPTPSGEGHEIRILIGGEHPEDAMRVCSVITTRYAGPSGLQGVLSVVGPTRMDYPRAVSMVRYMSSLMEELLGVYFA